MPKDTSSKPTDQKPQASGAQEPVTDARINEILADWDGEDLLEGVRLLSEVYPSRTLKDGFLLTEIAEFYQRHHRLQK